MGSVFEDICKQYLWKLLLEGKAPVEFSDLGRWWGTNPKTKQQEEMDTMGTDKDTALFAECKWTNEKEFAYIGCKDDTEKMRGAACSPHSFSL